MGDYGFDFTHTADVKGTTVLIRGQQFVAVGVVQSGGNGRHMIVWRAQCAGCGQSFTTKSWMSPDRLQRVCDRCA